MSTALRRRRNGEPVHQDPEAIKNARENAGLTKRALADAIGISEQLMGDIERGDRNADPDRLALIAREVGCEVTRLMRKQAAR